MCRSGILFILFTVGFMSGVSQAKTYGNSKIFIEGKELRVEHDESAGTISVFSSNNKGPILIQNAREDTRPYIHPLMAPDGKGMLTEYRPKHHLHQTGLYWGLKLVNGRDYFMNWEGDYWRRISAEVIVEIGPEVRWKTVYGLLDENGNTILAETQTWSMKAIENKYILDLEWKGEAKIDITLGKFYVGGLFLRMPWHKGVKGEVVNALGQRNNEAETHRAIWADVGIQLEGRDDLAHIAIFDHPDNRAFPTPWRVDNELGVGPSIQILDDWKINKNETEKISYRLIAYTGDLNHLELSRLWTEYVSED